MVSVLPMGYGHGFFRPDASTSTSPSPASTAPSPRPGLKHSTSIRREKAHTRTASGLPVYLDPRASQPNGEGSGGGGGGRGKGKEEGEVLCDEINREEDLYAILGVERRARVDEIRRAFLGRSRVCHPDKLPQYGPATSAFQRLSYAYDTLSKPTSRRMYDLGGGRGIDPGSPRTAGPPGGADETLNGVLRHVFAEFMAGDFEVIRAFVSSASGSSSSSSSSSSTADGTASTGLGLGDDALDNLEGLFHRIRSLLLSGQKYLRLVRFELLRLYEIQHSLRQLSYFDVLGRMRLTLALTRVTLEIPMVLDRAMREEVVLSPNLTAAAASRPRDGGEEERERGRTGGLGEGEGTMVRRGLLGPRVKGVLVVVCKVLERGERFGI